MNLTKLFNAQRQLDEHIEQEHPRVEGEDRLAKKILALQVELGELANECPDVFKFWSNKVMNREKALEEYVDCLHFILSIGLEMELEFKYDEFHFYQYDTPTDQFIRLMDYAVGMREDDYYNELFLSFIHLGGMLGFKWSEIETAYFNKNTINHQRQENNY